MGFEVNVLTHPYGTGVTLSVSPEDSMVADIYEDQYSVNWTTRRTASEFVKAFLQIAGNLPAILLTQSSEAPIESVGYETFQLTEWEELRSDPVTLLRFWLKDSTVAWQDCTISGARTASIVGLSSNGYDRNSFAQFFRWSATLPLLANSDAEIDEVSDRLGQFPSLALSLGAAHFDSEGDER